MILLKYVPWSVSRKLFPLFHGFGVPVSIRCSILFRFAPGRDISLMTYCPFQVPSPYLSHGFLAFLFVLENDGLPGLWCLGLVSVAYCQSAKLDTRFGLGLVNFLNCIMGMVTEADERERVVATEDICSGVGMLHYDSSWMHFWTFTKRKCCIVLWFVLSNFMDIVFT
jgi:hypothetical protein